MALQNPSATMSEIVTTTLRNRSKKLADNVTKNNALLMRLRKRGNIRTVSGGRTIVENLEYAENGTFKRYSGYETLNISPSDVFTAAEFNYAQAAVAVSISGLEELQNSGEAQIIDLLEARIKNAERTLVNNIALDVYSDGTADGGRQINGLQALIAAVPTSGTVGGIDRSATIATFWRNQKYGFSADGSTTASATTIQKGMNNLYVKTVRGPDTVDLIVADNVYYLFYLESLQAIQRITTDEMASAGFSSLKYMNSDVVLDGGYGGGAPTSSMFFLNTNYIHFRPHVNRYFAPIGDERFSVNQDAMVKLIGFAGNLTLSNAFLQGRLLT
jgi:hypothetical protein